MTNCLDFERLNVGAYDDRFNEDTNDGMYVNRRALVPARQFAVCPEAFDVFRSIAAHATERNISLR